MKRALLFSLLLVVPLSVQAQTVSHIRIVRISMVSGSVEMNQQNGDGWHKALLNAPVSERTQLRTGAEGRVAVEFEDASQIQLPPASQIDFTTLSLQNKERQNVVTLVRGTAFFSLHKHDSDAFVARFPGGFATVPDGKAWFRVDLGGTQFAADNPDSAVALQARVRVLNDKVAVQSPEQVYLLKKNDQLTLHASAPAELAKNKALDSLDVWSQQLDTQAQVRGKSIHNAPGYGLAELSSYGTWSGGYWYPNVAAGWSPYANGNWFWNPAMGYTWVSAYPWGWLPYHYGTWLMSPGGQWYWAPGTNWNYTTQPVVAAGGGSVAISRPPLPMPPQHRRTVTTIQPTTSTFAGAGVRSGAMARSGLVMPPADVRRVVLPSMPSRTARMPLNPAQRAAMARANESRMEVIRQQQLRMQMGMRRGMNINRSSQPAGNRVDSPRMSTPASTPRMAPSPRMQSMPRMESMPRMGGAPSGGGTTHH